VFTLVDGFEEERSVCCLFKGFKVDNKWIWK